MQSAHWKQSQVALFICVTRFQSKTQLAVVVSDNLKYNKAAIIIFINQILSLKPTDGKIVKIQSGGSSSQFKNQFVVKAFDFLTEKHDIIINWNFFATSHERDQVDDVEAALICRTWKKTKNQLPIINDLESFITGVSDVIILKITNTELEQGSIYLNLLEIFQPAISIPKISKCMPALAQLTMFW